ncbi:MAG: GNAT family N-acetyltransferase [Tissierellia bacterium]|nr:GNAT family N-acetyltransferase [Tissierellia bacterium]
MITKISLGEDLELRPYTKDQDVSFALLWYRDEEDLEMIDGKDHGGPYSLEQLQRMYEYLSDRGEVYIIYKKGKDWIPIGDVTFSQKDMPIVLAGTHRQQGIGRRVVKALLQEGKRKGWTWMAVREVYYFNAASKRLFESCGFVKDHPTAHGWSYIYHFDEGESRHVGGEGILR